MKVVRSTVTLFTFVLTAIVAAACGGSASLSPVAPSSSSGGASISGTISGSAIAAPLAVDSGSFTMLDARSVTVTVVGTGISTTADNHGQFTLNNVPEGTVQLNFTGPGSNATVTLTGVGPNDKVQISVTVNGNSAHVDSEHHSAPDNNKREFQGRISSIDANAKSFQIPGLTVKTTATTIIRHGNKTMQFADLKVGDHIEARGTIEGTTLTATEVKVEREGEDDDDAEDDHGDAGRQAEVGGIISGSTGTCPSVTFTVQSTKVTVNKDTAFPHTSCADATKNGAKVEVNGAKQTDGSILATRVSLDD
jgi:Domain of unknown function (DUF5666)